jgi:hypothetical protein
MEFSLIDENQYNKDIDKKLSLHQLLVVQMLEELLNEKKKKLINETKIK